MRNTYDWEQISAEFRLAAIKFPELSMAAFARSRGIPSSTFRKAIRRIQRQEQQIYADLQTNQYQLVIKHLRKAIVLLNNQ